MNLLVVLQPAHPPAHICFYLCSIGSNPHCALHFHGSEAHWSTWLYLLSVVAGGAAAALAQHRIEFSQHISGHAALCAPPGPPVDALGSQRRRKRRRLADAQRRSSGWVLQVLESVHGLQALCWCEAASPPAAVIQRGHPLHQLQARLGITTVRMKPSLRFFFCFSLFFYFLSKFSNNPATNPNFSKYCDFSIQLLGLILLSFWVVWRFFLKQPAASTKLQNVRLIKLGMSKETFQPLV